MNSPLAKPPVLVYAINNASVTLDQVQSSQLILAVIERSSVKLSCYDKSKAGTWLPNETLGVVDGHVGKNGINDFKKEGDGCTPSGIFRLGFAFGNRERPETRLQYRTVTENSWWVDDPQSRYYNQWFEGSVNSDWTSAEHLCNYQDSYAYAVVIEYNTGPVSPEKGSAIFLHCGNKPTAGCIAVPEVCLLEILKWLDPEKTPVILVTKEL